MQKPEAELKLKEKFQIDSFYDNQWETISNILEGKRILLIEKTGFGKSLCYQFPAVIFEGVTVIFSPAGAFAQVTNTLTVTSLAEPVQTQGLMV